MFVFFWNYLLMTQTGVGFMILVGRNYRNKDQRLAPVHQQRHGHDQDRDEDERQALDKFGGNDWEMHTDSNTQVSHLLYQPDLIDNVPKS